MPLYDFQDGQGPVEAHQHPKGGGWVADAAKVDPEAYVSEWSVVYGNSIVCAGVLIVERSKVRDSKVEGTTRIEFSELWNCDLSEGAFIIRHSTLLYNVLTGLATLSRVDVRHSLISGNWNIHTSSVDKSQLEGSGSLSDSTYLVEANLKGNFDLQGSSITGSSIGTPTGLCLGKCKIQSKGEMNVSGTMFATEILDGAYLDLLKVDFKHSKIYGSAILHGRLSLDDCLIYGDAYIFGDNLHIKKSEVFGVTQVCGPGLLGGAYLYAGSQILVSG